MIMMESSRDHSQVTLIEHYTPAYLLTPPTREAAIATVKNVFPQPAFQLLYSAHTQVNTMKEG